MSNKYIYIVYLYICTYKYFDKLGPLESRVVSCGFSSFGLFLQQCFGFHLPLLLRQFI